MDDLMADHVQTEVILSGRLIHRKQTYSRGIRAVERAIGDHMAESHDPSLIPDGKVPH